MPWLCGWLTSVRPEQPEAHRRCMLNVTLGEGQPHPSDNTQEQLAKPCQKNLFQGRLLPVRVSVQQGGWTPLTSA